MLASWAARRHLGFVALGQAIGLAAGPAISLARPRAIEAMLAVEVVTQTDAVELATPERPEIARDPPLLGSTEPP